MTEAETWREAAKLARGSKLSGPCRSPELFGQMLADMFAERAVVADQKQEPSPAIPTFSEFCRQRGTVVDFSKLDRPQVGPVLKLYDVMSAAAAYMDLLRDHFARLPLKTLIDPIEEKAGNAAGQPIL